MWADAKSATAWAFLFLALITALFLLIRPGVRNRRSIASLSLPVILLIAGVARLLPALWLPVGAGYDIESYRLVTDALLSGVEVYGAALGRHPYLPFQMFIMGAMAHLAQVSGLPYVVAIKLPSIAADMAITAIIFRVIQKHYRRPDLAAYFAVLYALNPVSILVTSYHGQFEAITLLLLVLAWYTWQVSERRTASAVALGLAILNKTWPILFLPVVLLRISHRRGQAIYAALALGIPVLAVATYLFAYSADPMTMLGRALTHRGVAGYWGPGAILFPAAEQWSFLQPVAQGLLSLRNWLLLGAVLIALWQTRSQPALDAFLTLLLSVFVVTVGIGIQWLLWLVPFGLLAVEARWTRRYSLAATFMLTIHLYGLHLFPWLREWFPPASADWIIRLSALPAWITVLAWAISRYRPSPSGQVTPEKALEAI